jgi:hypothetical protein
LQRRDSCRRCTMHRQSHHARVRRRLSARPVRAKESRTRVSPAPQSVLFSFDFNDISVRRARHARDVDAARRRESAARRSWNRACSNRSARALFPPLRFSRLPFDSSPRGGVE